MCWSKHAYFLRKEQQMRKIRLVSLILVLMLALVPMVSADTPAPGGPFSTAFYIQNLSGSIANCTYAFYNASGAASFTSSQVQISPGSALEVFVPNLSGLAAGSYAGVVSCDQQAAAIVNYSDADSGASYSGVTSSGTTWFAPALYDNYFSFYSNIVVQNTSASPVNITVEIFAAGSTSPVDTMSASNVPAFASANFEQENRAALTDNVVYSAKITGTGAIAPIVNIYGRGGVGQQIYSYNPFTSGATTMFAPVLFNNYYGFNTSLSVQNIGSAPTNITVTYGTGQVQSTTLNPNQSIEYYTPLVPGMPSGPTGITGATITSSGQPIVALVNESSSTNNAASYSAFASGSTTVRLPSLFRRYFLYNSSVTCQNIGGAAATMTLQYAVGGSSTSPSIGPGGTHEFYQGNDPALADGTKTAGTVTSAQPIVCVGNQSQDENPTAQDLLFAYNGLGQ
jgi:hypothetical protein